MFKDLHFVIQKIRTGIALLTVAGSCIYAQQWENVGGIQDVSAGGSSFNNLVIDNSGNYYLSYYDVSVAKGSVQKFNGNSWSYLGGTPGVTTGTATYNSLSVSPNGNSIYYTNQLGYPGSGMEVRLFTGSLWSQLPNATENPVNYQASAVSSDNIIFTYGSYGSGTVKRYFGGAWAQIGNAGFSGGADFAEMVIGTNNTIYTCNVSGGVKVYQNSTSADSTHNWTLVGGAAAAAASSGEQYNADIALDGANTIFIAYVSDAAGGRKLNVKKFDGNSWVQVGNANFSEGSVQHIALAVTGSGTPYVVASRFENDNFLRNTVYKLDDSQNWVPFGGDFVSDGEAKYNDLAIDKAQNYLVLAYSDNTTKVKRISLNLNPLTCSNTDPGANAGDVGCVTFMYRGQQVAYTTVRGSDGKIWLQQNLGSAQVASSVSDANSYGDLFQWGRWDDGHQLRNSQVVQAPSPNTPEGTGTTAGGYIAGSPAWWAGFSGGDTWNGASIADVNASVGVDPCKAIGPDWKMPSQTDWATLVSSEGIANPATAYNSHLKLPAGGFRSSSDGNFTYVGQRGYFWSSDTSSSGGKYLYIGTTIANPSAGAMRGQGASVRCIKPTSSLSTSDITLNKAVVGVYPNPTKEILMVKSDAAIEKVNVTNAVGQRMNVQFSDNQINMTELPSGLYIVELKLKNGQIVSKKIIKD
ncbi:T9SS type A sorting domain-containing protein [Chryseobacterium culicis]|uniref:Major paralogous domain-containing protein/Por secretion system C-terminal sorting domain-containing protein n=1 Tax=Chryseobacterium culicis TaxID=680127 RepID=A0A1H6I6G2_CHRCI|nr:T9SS type A sorting domain-containing protein [Chryseobacterium culicis]SEH42397.1 major paralogous domain-containing protein/Por secretion system C-terminal sorting domain-containing protein [Chryseobacterium culicis]